MNDFCLRINTGTSNYRSKGGILGKKILFYKVDQCWRKNNKVGKQDCWQNHLFGFSGIDGREEFGAWKKGSTCDRFVLNGFDQMFL